jgi:hypothetical protein
MHTVVETPVFIRSADNAGITEEERHFIVTTLANDPDAGNVIPGTGGARKIRFAARGKGKSGGYRVITFFSGADIPVFLLDIYVKGEKINLTRMERNILKRILGEIVETYRSKEDE